MDKRRNRRDSSELSPSDIQASQLSAAVYGLQKSENTPSEANISSDEPFPLHISVGAAPRPTMDLDVEVRLVKAALLYADKVTLYSPSASLVGSFMGLVELTDDEKLAFVINTAPILLKEGGQELLANLDQIERLKRKPNKSYQELVLLMKVKAELPKEMAKIWETDVLPMVEQLLESTGANQLGDAINAGMLTIAPLTPDEDGGLDTIVDSFVEKLSEILSGSSYPLFDDPTGNLVRSGISEGKFRKQITSEERGKQVTLASSLFGQLRAFPDATVAEIVDIRRELCDPLTRFRAAIVEFGRLIQTPAYDEEFPLHVEQVYREKIAPALAEITELMQGPRFRRFFAGEIIVDAQTVLSSALVLGLSQYAGLSDLITGAATALAPMLHASAKAA
jgi:hypothetical protein